MLGLDAFRVQLSGPAEVVEAQARSSWAEPMARAEELCGGVLVRWWLVIRDVVGERGGGKGEREKGEGGADATYPSISEHANVCDTYIVRFFQSRANETVVSEFGPLPAQMQSPQIYEERESVTFFDPYSWNSTHELVSAFVPTAPFLGPLSHTLEESRVTSSGPGHDAERHGRNTILHARVCAIIPGVAYRPLVRGRRVSPADSGGRRARRERQRHGDS